MRKQWVGLAGMSLANVLGCLDFTIVNTALPAIQTSFSVSMSELQWVINAFMLTLSASMVVLGRIADLYGRRRLLLWGMLGFALASLGAGLSSSLWMLVSFRILQGLAVAILYTAPMALLPSLFEHHERSLATGILVSGSGIGLALGPVLGGIITSVWSWHWIFWINLPIIALSFLLVIWSVPESKAALASRRLDAVGVFCLIVAFPMIVFATVEGHAWGWLSLRILGLYGVSLITLLLFYRHEHRTAMPIVNFDLFKNRQVVIGIAANFMLAAFYTVTFFLMPLYLHQVRHLSLHDVGLTLLPGMAMVAILSPIVGRLVTVFGHKRLLILGFLLFALSALMQRSLTGSSGMTYVILSLVFFGTGWALILSPSIIATLSEVPETAAGLTMGMLCSLHNFGGAIGLALAMVIFDRYENFIPSFHAVMDLLLAVAGVGVAIVLFGIRGSRSIIQR